MLDNTKMKDAAYCCVFRFLGVNELRLFKKICLCVIAALTVLSLLSACRSERTEGTTVQKNPTTVAGTAYQSTTTADTGENNADISNTEKTRTADATAPSAKTEETRTQSTTTAPPANTTVPVTTTTGQVQYKEWSYLSATGDKVTYTENPDNKYIAKAAEQLGVPANKLSASYNSKGATVFLFSSSAKSKETLTDCYIIFSEKMTIEKNIRKDGTTGSNKALADILYSNAMKKEP